MGCVGRKRMQYTLEIEAQTESVPYRIVLSQFLRASIPRIIPHFSFVITSFLKYWCVTTQSFFQLSFIQWCLAIFKPAQMLIVPFIMSNNSINPQLSTDCYLFFPWLLLRSDLSCIMDFNIQGDDTLWNFSSLSGTFTLSCHPGWFKRSSENNMVARKEDIVR